MFFLLFGSFPGFYLHANFYMFILLFDPFSYILEQQIFTYKLVLELS
jgi:hypothetical protein